MNLFLAAHLKSPFGIRLSTHNYSIHEAIHSYPLYAVAGINTSFQLLKKDNNLY